MASHKIAGIGEILFDIFGETEKLGGAPINFAYHAAALGATGIAVTSIGNDRRGRKALEILKGKKMGVDCISMDEDHPTGYVVARIDGQGNASYEFPDDVAWDHLRLNQRAMEMAPELDAICFGSLAQRSPVSRQAIRRYLAQTSDRALKIFDINLRQDYYTENTILESLKLADVAKLNEDELTVLAAVLNISGDDRTLLAAVVKRFSLKLAVLTRGPRGSLLVSRKESVEHPGVPIAEIADTVGAGDSFTAMVAIGMLNGEDLQTISERSNRRAAEICSRTGAMPKI
jgi:fructokinase